jgi:hypothetical protein
MDLSKSIGDKDIIALELSMSLRGIDSIIGLYRDEWVLIVGHGTALPDGWFHWASEMPLQ